jgi:hypothetical protein
MKSTGTKLKRHEMNNRHAVKKLPKRGSVFAIVENMLEYPFIKFLFTIVALLSVIFTIKLLLVHDFGTDSLERRLIFFNLFYSKDAFNYVDKDTGRVYPGVIDLVKFQQKGRLDYAAYFTNNNHVAVKFTLKTLEGKEYVAYMNQRYFDLQYPYARSVTANSAGSIWSISVPVVYLVDPAKPDMKNKGLLLAEVILEKN